MANPSTSPPSTGRDATIEALVAAATRLFATHGPDAVALRTVANEAGVNYGLIHQYVGTKEDLLRMVVRSVSEMSARDVAATDDLDSVIARFIHDEPTPYVAMLTWALLQGRDARDLLGRSPALTALGSRVPDTTDRDARIATVVALSLGWQLFGEFIAAGLGRDAEHQDSLTQEVQGIARTILTSRRATSTPRKDR